MSRLILHFTESTLLLLEEADKEVLGTTILLETNKPFARERMAGPIKEALAKHTLLCQNSSSSAIRSLTPWILF